MSLYRDIKEKKKGFFKYVEDKRKTRENVDPLLSGIADLVTEEMEKDDILNDFFGSAFVSKTIS